MYIYIYQHIAIYISICLSIDSPDDADGGALWPLVKQVLHTSIDIYDYIYSSISFFYRLARRRRR